MESLERGVLKVFLPLQMGDARESITILSSNARRALQASLVLGVRRPPPPPPSEAGKQEDESYQPSGESRGGPRGDPRGEPSGESKGCEQAAALDKEDTKKSNEAEAEQLRRKGLWGRLRGCLRRGASHAEAQGSPGAPRTD